MASNNHFAVALHSLSVLGVVGRVVSSEDIAQSVSTNPVVVRRILGSLVKEGFVSSEPGKNGGFRLAKTPREIRLDDVLRAVDGGSVFKVHDNPENQNCAVSCGIKGVLGSLLEGVDDAVYKQLHRTTLADIIKNLKKP